MDIAASDQWSAGCESGWTVYLDESYISRHHHDHDHDHDDHDDIHQSYIRMNSTIHDVDEDMSMVSDASSGPPQHEQHCYYTNQSSRNQCYSTNFEKSSKQSHKKSKKTIKKVQKKVGVDDNNQHLQYHPFTSSNPLLDDTASSPSISHSQTYPYDPSVMGFSQSMSATHFQGNTSYSNQYAYWQNSQVNDADHSAQLSQWTGKGWE